MIHRLARALEAARLTAEERQAIAWVCGDVADITGPTEDHVTETAGADEVTKRRPLEISANNSYRSNDA
jgi:hypothetical protein